MFSIVVSVQISRKTFLNLWFLSARTNIFELFEMMNDEPAAHRGDMTRRSRRLFGFCRGTASMTFTDDDISSTAPAGSDVDRHSRSTTTASRLGPARRQIHLSHRRLPVLRFRAQCAEKLTLEISAYASRHLMLGDYLTWRRLCLSTPVSRRLQPRLVTLACATMSGFE